MRLSDEAPDNEPALGAAALRAALVLVGHYCVHCKAQPGQRCTYPSGGTRPSHHARWVAWKLAQVTPLQGDLF